MPLGDEIRTLADQILARLDEARDFYLHTWEAWRAVQEFARDGAPLGIVDAVTEAELQESDLKLRAHRYVTLHLPEAVFKNLYGLMADWVLGLTRLWLTANPEDLDLRFDKSKGKRVGRKEDEIHIPLSRLLAMPDRDALIAFEIDRAVRKLAYDRPEHWFRYLEARLKLGLPDEFRKQAFFEMKVARDVLEHNRGIVNPDYVDKAGDAARYAVGELIQIDEPYLLGCFMLLRSMIMEMAETAVSRASVRRGLADPSRP